MKKTSILLGLAIIILLSGCNKNNPSPAPTTNNDENLNCFSLCHNTIPELCEDVIVDYEANDVNVMTNDTVYNDEYCEAQCASWTPEMMKCVSSAKSCDQIGPAADSCTTNEPESPFVTDPEVKVNENCDTACKNYSDCTKYTEGVGPQDIVDAYNTCMEGCATWDAKNISCMAKAKVSSPTDCMAVTMCGLSEYNGIMESN